MTYNNINWPTDYTPTGWNARWAGVPPTYPQYGPPSPPWLSQFAPSQVTGQPITRERMPIPSAQMWGRTPWSQRQGLSGYAEWAGYEPLQDLLDRMYMMLPQTPRGVGYRRWMPFRQR